MNTETIETLLEEEIREDLKGLKNVELGSEEYKNTVPELTKLLDRAIELKKIDVDVQEKAKNRDNEREIKLESIRLEHDLGKHERMNEMRLKEEQFKEEKKHKWIDRVLQGLAIVVPVLATVWGVNRTLKFDETETITSSMGRGFVNNLLPKKK